MHGYGEPGMAKYVHDLEKSSEKRNVFWRNIRKPLILYLLKLQVVGSSVLKCNWVVINNETQSVKIIIWSIYQVLPELILTSFCYHWLLCWSLQFVIPSSIWTRDCMRWSHRMWPNEYAKKNGPDVNVLEHNVCLGNILTEYICFDCLWLFPTSCFPTSTWWINIFPLLVLPSIRNPKAELLLVSCFLGKTA